MLSCLAMRLYPLCVSALLFAGASLHADVVMPRILSSGMIVQRDQPLSLFGRADPGEKVTAIIGDDSASTLADAGGKWRLSLPARKGGESFEIRIKGNNELVLNDVLAGDVWVCSGQSNMETNMARLSEKYAKEISECANPALRMFTAPMAYNFQAPQDDLPSGQWLGFRPENVATMSGVAFFFAQYIEAETGVPVGIINVSNGGSPIAAWLGREQLEKYPDLLEEAARWAGEDATAKAQERNNEIYRNWAAALDSGDPGMKAGAEWFLSELDCSDWSTVSIPGKMADQGMGQIGSIWLRREVDIPAELAGREATLRLGNIIHADTAYINGQRVGETGYEYPPRRYSVPEGLLKAGRNVVALRVSCTGGPGAVFIGDKPYQLDIGEEIYDLKGEWLCKKGAEVPAREATVFIQWKPMGLHNGMYGPIRQLGVKGVVWYQGESDTWQPTRYAELMRSLVADWRGMWGNVPVLLQQLPNFMEPTTGPAESGWADFREIQRKSLTIPLTALSVAIDIGEWNDIHPLNKKDVGYRLSLAARNLAYGQDIVAGGPLYHSMNICGGRVELRFDSVGGGLLAKDGPELRQFTLAGTDGVFHMAEARIEGDKVFVWSKEVPEPRRVRYAWASNPQGANLYNAEGLPASPFEASLD